MPENSFTIVSYPGKVPPFVEQSLETLYGSLYSTLPHLRLHGATDAASTYAAWHDDKLASLFLYRQIGKEIRVINEGMQLTPAEITCFADYVFEQYADVNRLHFHAVMLEKNRSARPSLRFGCTEDIVIALPDSEEAYLARLGKSTRKNLRHQLGRVQRTLADFSYEVHAGKATPDRVIRDIIGFNHARMAGKQRTSALTGETSDKLVALIRDRGLVGVVSANNGRVCGGTLACRIHHDVYSLVNAHDPAYDFLSLGSVCRHLMILFCIKERIQRFHLLGGHLATKQKVLGQRQRLDHLVLYRSRGALLEHAGGIAGLGAQSVLYHLRSWMERQELKKDNTCMTAATVALMRSLRMSKQVLKGASQAFSQSVRRRF
jgi:hypothetical protein